MDSEVEVKARILLVDDEDIIRTTFKDILERFGYHITVAADGNEAKAMVDRSKFDVVILDILLPDAIGLELIPDLKKNNPLLEVIVWTGHSPDYDFIGAVNAGASDWIVKPCTPLELHAKIERVLRERKTIGELAKKGDEKAKLAIEMYCYRIKKYIGAYCAALGRVDALVFTGGIGENAADIRSRCCEGLSRLAIEIDDIKNSRQAGGISEIQGLKTSLKILVIPTNEELEIAEQTLERIQAGA